MRTTREQVNTYLARLRDGKDCLEQFIDYSRGYLRYIAYKYLIDKSLVEDAIFLAYDRILRAVHGFDDSKNGLAWIVSITQNEALKLNSDRYYSTLSLEYYKAELTDASSPETACIENYDVERAMERLGEQERTVVEYKVYLGMTVREIAAEMDIPKSTVAYMLKNALKKLEEFLS